MTVKFDEHKEVLFELGDTALYQSDTLEMYFLTFKGEEIVFKACELISFRRKIQKVDLTLLLSSDTPDIELVSLPHCDRFFAFTTLEILELKELFAGAFAMLELNSLIHREIVRKGC